MKKQEEIEEPEFANEKWENIVPTAHNFPIAGSMLIVNENMDLFNSYRTIFKDYAISYSQMAKKEYDKRVHNLVTFVEFFVEIYIKYLDALATKANDIFVAERIWTVTKDSFLEKHVEKHHLAIDMCSMVAEAIENAVKEKQATVAAFTSLVPNLVGGGFGFKGALKGVLKAEAFNLVRDGVESSLIDGASNLSQAKQDEIFSVIDSSKLFTFVMTDYWLISQSICEELRDNGKNIWMPSDKETAKAKNIFVNISNPNFPQEEKLNVFISIMNIMPYIEEHIVYMVQQYGDNVETRNIIDYFGYSEKDGFGLPLDLFS